VRAPAWLASLALLAGCKWQFERMLVQHKMHDDDPLRLALIASAHLRDGTLEHRLPPGFAAPPGEDPAAFLTGCQAGGYVEQVPILVTEAVRREGRDGFLTFCAACHGPQGNGETPVAQAMTISKPKSLVANPVRSYPPGRGFRTITLGYKRMPSYRQELNPLERWAVVVYLWTLQSALPPGNAGEPASVSPGPVCEGGKP